MKREFFSALQEVLFCKDLDSRFSLFMALYEDFLEGKYIFDDTHKNLESFNLSTPSEVLHPTRIIRKKGAKSTNSIARTLHSVAHIEYCAITLALDSSYRFKGLPHAFYKDWLEVAKEEFAHFYLLQNLLAEIGFTYGDFPVHCGLYDAMQITSDSLKYRMGLVHRGLEARGLDSNPFVLAKLETSSHPIIKKVKETFGIILHDEIHHVSKGDIWWAFAKDTNDNFLDLCRHFQDFNLAGKTLNTSARLQCGFSQEEINALKDFYAKRKYI